MAQLVYPAMLPPPIAAPITSAERRALSEPPGPRQARALQRDRLADQQCDFIYSADEAEIFDAWWRTDLKRGGAWFLASWPHPSGASAVRRYTRMPSWKELPGGNWRVSATFEVRGRGINPVDCFSEPFDSLAAYASISGDAGLFTLVDTPYGHGLNVASQNAGTAAVIRRPTSVRTAFTLAAKFKLTSLAADDAALLSLYRSGSSVVAFNPRREVTFDALRRARLIVGAEGLPVTAGSLLVDTWYGLELAIVAGAGNTVCVIRKLSDNSVVQSTALASSHTPPSIDAIDFNADSAGVTSATIYTDVHVC